MKTYLVQHGIAVERNELNSSDQNIMLVGGVS